MPAYLRDFDFTGAERLSWLQYNVCDEVAALNVVSGARDLTSASIHRSTFPTGETITFTYGDREYSLAIPPPELPS